MVRQCGAMVYGENRYSLCVPVYRCLPTGSTHHVDPKNRAPLSTTFVAAAIDGNGTVPLERGERVGKTLLKLLVTSCIEVIEEL